MYIYGKNVAKEAINVEKAYVAKNFKDKEILDNIKAPIVYVLPIFLINDHIWSQVHYHDVQVRNSHSLYLFLLFLPYRQKRFLQYLLYSILYLCHSDNDIFAYQTQMLLVRR